MDDEKPAKKPWVLRPKDVVPIDSIARPGDGTEISVRLIHLQNRQAQERAAARKPGDPPPFDGSEREATLPRAFKPKRITPLDPPSGANDPQQIAVPDILIENRKAEEASGWGRLRFRKKKMSKRNRDFFLWIGLSDLVILAVIRYAGGAMTLVYGVSAITLLTSMAAWIMFVVMDDY